MGQQISATRLIAINPAAVAKLSDGTFWRIAPGRTQIGEAIAWAAGTDVVVITNPKVVSMWPSKMKNLETGAEVSVVTTKVRF